MAFDLTKQQLLQQAALMDLKYAATGNQQFRDEAVRLRRVKVDLDDFVPGASELDDLNDVTVTSPTGGEVLVYNSGTSQWENQTLELDDLSDVTITSPANGEVLTYNSVTSEWENKALVPTGLYSQTGPGTPITNTVAPTTLINGGVGTLTVPANGFSVGDAFVAYFSGIISSVNNKTIKITVSTATSTLVDTGFITLPATTNKDWELQINFVIRNTGAAGVAQIMTSGRFFYNKDASNTPESIGFRTLNNTTFDTTISNTLDVIVQWGEADIGNSIYSEVFNLHRLY